MSNYKKYLTMDYKSDKMKFIAAMSAIWFFGGLYGVIYETIFYYFDNLVRFSEGIFFWRGGGFLPWLQIYGFGAWLIYIAAHRFRDKPILVCLSSGLICGIFEFLSGFICYGILGLPAGWDYNEEILSYGNICGYVCIRSILVFAVSGLLLIYVIFPFVVYISEKINRKAFIIIFVSLGMLCMIDFLYNDIVRMILPDSVYAQPLYESFGIMYRH